MKKIVMLFSLFLLIGMSLQAELPSVLSIMKEMEKQQDISSDVTAKMKITQKKVDQGIKVMEAVFYRRDADDSFLMVFTAPDSDKGNGYLRSGDNFWMYRRNTRTFQHINRDENIGGSDAKAGDMERKKFTELYAPALENGKEVISEEKLGKIPVYKFKVTAITKDVTYPVQVYWVTKSNFLTLKQQSYSLSGTLMSTGIVKKYTKIEGKYMPVVQIFTDEFEKGNKSMMEMSGISLKKLDSNIFTKGYLENLSK